MKRTTTALAVTLTVIAAGCAGSTARAKGSAEVIRLGVFPNLTHAPALVGVATGVFDRDLAPTKVKVTVFNSGSQAGQALLSGSLDATYIGPVPAASLFEAGAEVSLVSGAVQNGASLIIRNGSGIQNAADLAGKKIAVPGIGNTQDIALRTWLHQNSLKTKDEGGDVAVVAINNPQLPEVFKAKQVDAAWEPEPWPSVLESQNLATEMVDETSLWPAGAFPTTGLLVSSVYLGTHPDIVRKLVQANVDALDYISKNPEKAKQLASEQLQTFGGPTIGSAALDQAWTRLRFSYDPLPPQAEQYAMYAFQLGAFETKPDNLAKMFALDDLNAVLQQKGLPAVEVPA
jgi:NitT/TauT family transport system substrate-binding protein